MQLKNGDIFAEHYQLKKLLGVGSFGEVWLARNILADVDVAIKLYGLLDDNGIKDFREEFKLAYKLHHPNLLHLNHFDVFGQCPFLVMPYCPKGSSASLKGKISEKQIWRFIRDVSCGLMFLHNQNPPIIHQDIKPDNILIGDDDKFIISDFGISRKLEHTFRKSINKVESSGTLAYMGPERFGPSPAPIMASDIWSLGATMYELLTGMPPYGDHGGVLQKNGADIPLINEDFSQELKDIIYKCLALNPWDRPTARQIADYTSQHINGSPVPFSLSNNSHDTLQEEEDKTHEDSISAHSSDINKMSPYQDKGKRKKVIVVAAITAIFATIVIIFSLISCKEPVVESIPEPTPTIDYDQMCLSIIQEGENSKIQGDVFRFDIDTLKQNNDSVFEDFYINAIGKYRQINYYKDSISAKIYLNATELKQQVEAILDSAYHVFKEKANIMKDLDQAVAAQAFEDRAKKIEPYINIDNNENE